MAMLSFIGQRRTLHIICVRYKRQDKQNIISSHANKLVDTMYR